VAARISGIANQIAHSNGRIKIALQEAYEHNSSIHNPFTIVQRRTVSFHTRLLALASLSLISVDGSTATLFRQSAARSAASMVVMVMMMVVVRRSVGRSRTPCNGLASIGRSFGARDVDVAVISWLFALANDHGLTVATEAHLEVCER